MTVPVSLLPLKCLRCEAPVPAAPQERAWICQQCAQGLLLDPDQGLLPLEVHYAAGIPENAPGRPFWIAQGSVSLDRKAYGFGSQDRASQEFWNTPRQFVIPAFDCQLVNLLELGVTLLEAPPALTPGKAVPFAPVVRLPADLHALAEFIVVAVEAERKDQVRQILFNLQLSEPQLWVLP